jgi:hypothetical protein
VWDHKGAVAGRWWRRGRSDIDSVDAGMACAGWRGSIESVSSSRSWARAGAEETELEGF